MNLIHSIKKSILRLHKDKRAEGYLDMVGAPVRA